MTRPCRRGLHDLDDEANVYVTPSTGVEQCRPCKRARQGEYDTAGTTVVTFRADRARECLLRYREWAGPDARVGDLGTLDGVRRVRVDEERWRAYTRQASTRPAPTTNSRLRMFACGQCDVEAVSGALDAHQRATGHEGRAEL